jgi:RNA polymerase sigma-70 factor (ECF subfamily)
VHIDEAELVPAPALPDDASEAIKLLYSREGEAVYRTIYGIVLDAAEAQDLTQETFVRAYRAWDRFDRVNARAWLLRIGTNLAITHYRTQRRRRRVAPWLLLSGAQSEEPQRQSEDKDLVAWLMRPLTPEQRSLITLHYYQQVPRAEIADQLGIPVGTVASRINKAMQLLRQRAQAIGVMQLQDNAGRVAE